MVLLQVLSVAVILGTGIVAGVLFAVAISVMPALIAMPVDRYITTHRLLGRRYDHIMPYIVTTSVAVDIFAAVRTESTASRPLFALAAVFMVGVAVVSQTRNVPINNRVKSQDENNISPDFQDPRLQWRNWHAVRTTFAIVALVLTAAAVAVLR
ncbi:DUF1772 domain-containing protein [Streptomyces sp. H10-C2]|uniref:DUF1772 domain-containing protein n=1 Tax=unclassified Streptomyces TaxID=2593676 RepID=UPI0024BB153D|nr:MULTISPECIES: DUF1772 domain-containing protein [unclassified Streptomyces]MDJ0346941.1 DUF1772 domain-containing protein [Streptomyces sp. PH10-H1]MDJ0370464.1 DUF1772 domain-containing protein [Streptomyces sp. H10-C2]